MTVAKAPADSPRGPTRQQRRNWLTAYLFVLPATLLIAVFGLFPIGYSVYMSLYTWRVRKGAFIGLRNYESVIGDWWGALAFFGGLALILVAHWLWTDAFKGERARVPAALRVVAALTLLSAGVSIALGWGLMMDAGNKGYLKGLVRTVYYGFGSVPVQIVLALVIATLLFQKIRGQEFFRMLYFLPYITPAVAGGAIFRNLFSPREERLANVVLGFLGIPPQRWLFETKPVTQLLFGGLFPNANWSGFWAGPSLALVTIIIYGIWTFTGYNAVIFLAGLGGISKELYDAAAIDGAGRTQQFRFITVPLLAPVTFYLTVLGFIGTFQAFTHIYVMRAPATRDAVDTASIVIFDTFYKLNNFSLAAAQSVILFVIILFLTLLQSRMFGRRALGA
ncbi:MAG: sugar ABC transporter permease [Trueperaceae bacterium]|nr:sugar ABC transporter permease [Trueperaceae bacterium]HRQ10117.1 sugar ABC transporter permease [Trueperaceae bacterium]